MPLGFLTFSLGNGMGARKRRLLLAAIVAVASVSLLAAHSSHAQSTAARVSAGNGQLSFDNPLVDAADRDDVAIVKALVDQGMSPNARGKFETTALIRTGYRGYTDLAKLLLEAGADVDAQDIGGATAMHVAARQGHIDVVYTLLQYGADINAQDEEGWTPLMRAASRDHTEVVQLLLESGANVDETTFLGETALMQAVKRRNPKSVAMLVKHGANPEKKDRMGRSSIDIAKSRRNEMVMVMLTKQPEDIAPTKRPAIGAPPLIERNIPAPRSLGTGTAPTAQFAQPPTAQPLAPAPNGTIPPVVETHPGAVFLNKPQNLLSPQIQGGVASTGALPSSADLQRLQQLEQQAIERARKQEERAQRALQDKQAAERKWQQDAEEFNRIQQEILAEAGMELSRPPSQPVVTSLSSPPVAQARPQQPGNVPPLFDTSQPPIGNTVNVGASGDPINRVGRRRPVENLETLNNTPKARPVPPAPTPTPETPVTNTKDWWRGNAVASPQTATTPSARATSPTAQFIEKAQRIKSISEVVESQMKLEEINRQAAEVSAAQKKVETASKEIAEAQRAAQRAREEAERIRQQKAIAQERARQEAQQARQAQAAQQRALAQQQAQAEARRRELQLRQQEEAQRYAQEQQRQRELAEQARLKAEYERQRRQRQEAYNQAQVATINTLPQELSAPTPEPEAPRGQVTVAEPIPTAPNLDQLYIPPTGNRWVKPDQQVAYNQAPVAAAPAVQAPQESPLFNPNVAQYWLRIGEFSEVEQAVLHFDRVTNKHNMTNLRYRTMADDSSAFGGIFLQVGPVESLDNVSDLCLKFRGDHLGCSAVSVQ